jgi:hypothetical protein
MAKVGLGTPPMMAKDEYLHSHFISWNALEQIIIQMTDVRDPRIPIFTDLLISAVTQEEVRDELRVKKVAYYEKALEEYKNPTPADKATAMVAACTRVAGDVRSWYDTALGVTTQMTYGVCGVLPGEDEDEARFGGGDDSADGESGSTLA